jgi:hypothetical protein
MRDKAFQEDLVVKFIQSIGLYPTGTLVELTSGDLGIVLEQNQGSRLSPSIAVLDQSATATRLGGNCIFIDLKDEKESRRLLLESGRDSIVNVAKLAIARDLEPSTYDVDYDVVSEIFLQSGARVEKPSESPGFFAGLKNRLFS